MAVVNIWIVEVNSDSTEGRGHMIPYSYHLSEQEAFIAAQGKGVMGVGPGQISHLTVTDHFKDSPFDKVVVFGYRKNSAGRWGMSWLDGRDDPDPDNNPEFKEYLRLKAIFENGR